MKLLSVAGPILALAPALAFAAPTVNSGHGGWTGASKCRDDCKYYKDDGKDIYKCFDYNGGKNCVKFVKGCNCKTINECGNKNGVCWGGECLEFVEARYCDDDKKDYGKHDHDHDKGDKKDYNNDHKDHGKDDKKDYDKGDKKGYEKDDEKGHDRDGKDHDKHDYDHGDKKDHDKHDYDHGDKKDHDRDGKDHGKDGKDDYGKDDKKDYGKDDKKDYGKDKKDDKKDYDKGGKDHGDHKGGY